MDYEIGYYELFGNTVYYDGDTVEDLDAREEMLVSILEIADYIGKELD